MEGWITLHASDGSFRLNASRWQQMTTTRLPELIEQQGWLFETGIAVVMPGGDVLLNVTTDVLRPLIDALQRLHMHHLSFDTIFALSAPPNVPPPHAESFWMLVEALKLMPYLIHSCRLCCAKATGSVNTRLCHLHRK